MIHKGFPSFGLCSGGSSDPFSSPLCVLSVSALSSTLPRLFLTNTTVGLPACPEPRREPSERSTFLRSSLATIPFRITFFARPHPLTPIESYSYKKQGRGWEPQHFVPIQAQRTCATRGNTRNPNLFIHLLNNSLGPPGVGGSPRSFARLHVLCVSALSSSPLRFSSLSKRRRP